MSSVQASSDGEACRKFGHRYPWAEWFSKKSFTLTRGEDFDFTVDIMARMIRNKNGKARRFGRLRIHINYDLETLAVEVTDAPKKRRK